MTAIHFAHDADNLALQGDCFRLSATASKAVLAEMKKLGRLTPGGYWTAHLADARRAVRSGKDAKVFTAGFGASEFFQVLRLAGVEVRTGTAAEIFSA